MLYGDGVITPAISVLGAVEGLTVRQPEFAGWIVPLAVVILVGLFLLQQRGTGSVGAIFGPVMFVWFAAIAALGLAAIVSHPEVLGAINPWHGVDFFVRNRFPGFLILGSVFLILTGAEALYADMGHFGARPIRLVWFALVLPALLLNYFGQGALLLRDASAAENLFFHLAPSWALYPMVVLATAAAVIASQAVISGAFSLTRQAVQLGYSPRVSIEHTSSAEIGQIYIPSVNWWLMLATIAVVLGFRSSTGLAGAYGVAVTSTMVITTLLLHVVSREVWGWSVWRATLLAGAFLLIDLSFFGANLVKIPQGGWLPLLIAAGIYTLMSTWKTGRQILSKRLQEKSVPLNILMADLAADPPLRVPGVAVFMSGNPGGTPPALVHNLAHNKVLHERVVFLTVVTEEVPHVSPAERVTVKHLGKGFHSVTVRYGFMEDPNILDIIAALQGAAAHDPARGHDILPRPGGARVDGPPRDGAVAGAAVRVHVAQRAARDGVLPDSLDAGVRGGRAGRALGGRPERFLLLPPKRGSAAASRTIPPEPPRDPGSAAPGSPAARGPLPRRAPAPHRREAAPRPPPPASPRGCRASAGRPHRCSPPAAP